MKLRTIVCTFLLSIPLPGYAAPIPGLFNTGVDDNGAPLPNGVKDPHYTLIESPDPAYPGPDAVTLLPGFPVGPWLEEGPHSRWISCNAASGNGEPGSYTFRTTFDLTGFDPAKVTITGEWATDNDGTDILLNGESVHSGSVGFGGFQAFEIPGGFQEGVNTLDFVVFNAGDTINPVGLRVQMTGSAEVAGEPPSMRVQPAGASVFENSEVILSPVVDGTPPIAYQWRKNGENMPGETDRTLFLPGLASDTGDYTLVATNAHGTVTSEVARVNILQPVPGTFPTGVDPSGNVLLDDSVDPHYTIILNADDETVTEAIVQDTTVFPIVDGTWVSNPEDSSRWIGPRFETSGAAAGDYTYRFSFDLTGFDPSVVRVDLSFATDDNLTDILVNGTSTGTTGGGFGGFASLSLSSGPTVPFVNGINTLDFRISNGAIGYTGLHVASILIGSIPSSGGSQNPPVILRQPADFTAIAGDTVVLDVLADGTPPFTYQWRRNGTDLNGRTEAALTLTGVTAEDAAEYSVVVANAHGSVTSETATLKVLNPVPGLFNTGTSDSRDPLGDLDDDLHYELVEVPEGLTPGPAVVLADPPTPPWIPNTETARWIGATGFSTVPPGTYLFRTTFSLAGFDPASAVLKGSWTSDNGSVIRLNGTPVATGTGNFGALTTFTVTGGFVAGVNVLEFVVDNAAGNPPADNPAGLFVTDLRAGALPGATLPDPPQFTIVRQPNGSIRLSFTPVAGWSPFRSTDLQNWQAADGVFTTDGAEQAAVIDPSTAPRAWWRFQAVAPAP